MTDPTPGLAPPPLHARSLAEVHLYLDLLGWPPGRRGQRLVRDGEDLLSEYRWDEAPAGVPAVVRVDVPPAVLAEAGFGGPERSSLLDPAAWREAAERLAASVPADLDASPDHRGARARLRRAAACLDQVLLFAEGDDIPRQAFFTPSGRATFNADPTRFDVGRVRAGRDALRALADRLTEPDP